MRGSGSIVKHGSRYRIVYRANGTTWREPGGATEAEAREKLDARLAVIALGVFVDPQQVDDLFEGLRGGLPSVSQPWAKRVKGITVEQILDAYDTHLTTKGCRSVRSFRTHVKAIRQAFGRLRAADLSSGLLEEFARRQQQAGYKNATINHGFEGLRGAYRLALRQETVRRVPYFPMLRVNNVRQGFLEPPAFGAILKALPDPITDIARFAYHTGWRKMEVLNLTWENVDREAGEIRLATSKNGEGRVIPLVGQLLGIIKRRSAAREFTDARGVTHLAEFVFHDRGRRFTDIGKAWRQACMTAGVGHVIFHDLRRSAVRNMIRAGVPQAVAMSISGHKTASMFERYNITSVADKVQALAKVETFAARVLAHGFAQKPRGPAPPEG